MLSNEDIFYIPGVHEIIIGYKEDMDAIIRKRVAKRRHKSLMKHVHRMKNHYNKINNQRNHETLIRRHMGIDF